MRRVIGLLLSMALTSAFVSHPAYAQSYYLKVDQHWYAVNSGTVAIDVGGNLVDAPGAVLQTSCRRSGGALPDFGTHTALLGTAVFDVIYTNSPPRFHATTPPVIELLTPGLDVSCGPGVTPPPAVVGGVNSPPSPTAPPLFSDGFEAT